jgi:NarL family two-component system sensor histidine kinase YdfH
MLSLLMNSSISCEDRDKQMNKLLNIRKYWEMIWNSEEKDANLKDLHLYKRDIRPIRWFILFWASMVYLWGCTQLLLGSYMRLPLGSAALIFIQPAQKLNTQLSQPIHAKLMYAYQNPDLLGVMLMILQFCLHWICLSGKLQRNWYWLYFLLQGLCTLALSFIWSDMIITLGLYLVLVIEVLSLIKQVRRIVVVVASYLMLFMLTVVWQLMNWAIWMTLESALLLIIFIIGWVILSMQQVHARSTLEAAHLQLAAYAMRVEELTLVNERQRLARELHDTLAQDLVGLTLQLERVDLHLDKQRFERARELVQQAMARARATLSETRSAIDDLRACTLGPDDLLLAIQREINRFTETTSIACVSLMLLRWL